MKDEIVGASDAHLRSTWSAGEATSSLADYVVEGRVRTARERLRITASLIEAEGQTHVWATTFDRTASDSLTLQVEVADVIARAVVDTLVGVMRAVVGL